MMRRRTPHKAGNVPKSPHQVEFSPIVPRHLEEASRCAHQSCVKNFVTTTGERKVFAVKLKIEGLSPEQQEELDAISGGGWISDESNRNETQAHCVYCGQLLEWKGSYRGYYCNNCKTA